MIQLVQELPFQLRCFSAMRVRSKDIEVIKSSDRMELRKTRP
jgi:hypothetical protein